MLKRFSKIPNKYVNSLLAAAVLALILNIFIETFSRHSLIKCFGYMINTPLVFLLNAMIIFATLCIATIFRRRVFWFIMISILWMTLGITNGAILNKRMTPFTVKDFSVLGDGISIVTNYVSMPLLILIGLAILMVIAGGVLLFIFGPKKPTKVNLKRNIVVAILIIACTFGAVNLGTRCGVLDTFFNNLAYAYRDNGVPYGFIVTWVETGISKPKGYSEDLIDKIAKDSDIKSLNDDVKKLDKNKEPNIIFLQLESFVDPSVFKNVKLSKDAIPNYRRLMKEYSSGSLTVPALGAGTANTEFESIVGLSAKFFGPGEYPYKSVLTEKTVESVPFDLKSAGYSTHAIHNHRGVFYNRNTVFANMGFDTFTSVEYMNDVVKTPNNWAKDNVLIKQITDALSSTKGKDYIYTISVQGHGKYPSEKLIKNPEITVTTDDSEEINNQYEYYVNMAHEMDNFVKKLTDTLSKYDEDVVLVMYGDHLPALDMLEEHVAKKDLYNTQYVIWNNFGMEKKDEHLYSFQIASEVLDRLDMHVGSIMTYHQNCRGKKDYMRNLEALGYDMLYGNRYLYGGTNPFKATKLQMGVNKIEIDDIVKIGSKYYIRGKNFTEYSKVTLDGEPIDTTFLGSSILAVEGEIDPEAVSKLKVSQVEKNKTILSTTE